MVTGVINRLCLVDEILVAVFALCVAGVVLCKEGYAFTRKTTLSLYLKLHTSFQTYPTSRGIVSGRKRYSRNSHGEDN